MRNSKGEPLVIDEGKLELAIKQLKMVNKNFERYKEATASFFKYSASENEINTTPEQLEALDDLPVINSNNSSPAINKRTDTSNELSFKILNVSSGVVEGWIDTSGEFFDEITLTILVENRTKKTFDIFPEMFILSDSAGYTPFLLNTDEYFDFIPLPPIQQAAIDLTFSVIPKKL